MLNTSRGHMITKMKTTNSTTWEQHGQQLAVDWDNLDATWHSLKTIWTLGHQRGPTWTKLYHHLEQHGGNMETTVSTTLT